MLFKHRSTLRRLYSFSGYVERINFTTYKGWAGKTYVDEAGHGVVEYKPDMMRGVDLLEIFYFKMTDTVVLTEDQYRDYIVVSGLNN
jgi:hypothetical protein